MSERIPPLPALRAIEAVARLGSLTRAAAALHVTHGAISHQLKALEEQLGVRLVERAGRGIKLTDEAERFAARVRSAMNELTDALRELSERRNPRQLRVTVVPSFAARWLLPRIGRFVAAHPDIDLDVRANIALADFRRDDVDVAIRYGAGHWPGLIAEHLLDDVYFPVCSPRFNGGRLPRHPEELATLPLLRSSDEFWQPWFEAAGLAWDEPARGPVFNDASHMLQAAIEGQGIGLARASLLGNDLRNGVLARLFDVAVPSPLRHYLAYPPRLAQSPKLAAFRDFLLAEIAHDAQLERTARQSHSKARRPPHKPRARRRA